jgi:hypothetical protein
MGWHAIYELLIFQTKIFIPFLVGYLYAKSKFQYRSYNMPSAVVTDNVSDKMPLKSLPPDGFVIVRRMNYGEELSRSSKATKLLVGGGDNKNNKDNFQGEVDIQTEAIALWDFANLVVDHNCEDADGRKLNFKNIADVKRLDSRVGKEIGQIIDDFNNVEDSEEVKNS